ncbi:partial threonine dehydratase, partial [Burkholderiaceae bacterium]
MTHEPACGRAGHNLPMTLTAADIHAAAERLQGQVLDTPCMPSRTLSAITGCEVFLKFENLQFTASFKERGALNKLAQLSAEERARGVLAVSAGNHAQGVAYHAQRLGIPATIVMPRFAPAVKVENTRRFGATVVLEGDTFDDARSHGLQLAKDRGLTVVHPYDDLDVAAGQGTIGLEMLAEQPGIDTFVVAIGGGGLISGVA